MSEDELGELRRQLAATHEIMASLAMDIARLRSEAKAREMLAVSALTLLVDHRILTREEIAQRLETFRDARRDDPDPHARSVLEKAIHFFVADSSSQPDDNPQSPAKAYLRLVDPPE